MDELQEGDPGQVGTYALLGRLGAGGMGRVYLGRSLGGRLVAVKVIHEHLAADGEFRVRFAREVQSAQRVSGVFTAPVIDSDANAPLPWLATGYVHGPSLSDAVASYGALPASSVLTLAAGLAEGLSAVHAAGVIHRDLKPSNVLLAQDGPRLIDFGISQASGQSPMTRTGMVLGTPGFMSPEQAEGLTVGPASDIFSLGAVLLFVGTGTRMAYFAPHLEQLSPELRPIVGRCMALDPARRPSASEFLTELITAHPSAADQTDWLPEGILPAGTSPFSSRGDRTPSPGTPVSPAPVSPAPLSPVPMWPRPVPPEPAPAAPAAASPAAAVPPPPAGGAAAPDGDRPSLEPVTMQDAWARTRTSSPPVVASAPGALATPPPTAAPPPFFLASLAPDTKFGATAPLRRPSWWRRRRVALAAAGTAVVLAAGGGVYVIGPWRTPPVLRPTGLGAVGRTAQSIDLGWSGPPSGPRPDSYVILRDGAKVGTVPGSSTSFDDKGLPPAASYDYRVIAYRGGHRSKSSAQRTLATVTPPAADGVLESDFSVSQAMADGDPDTTSWYQKDGDMYVVTSGGTWSDDWSFSPGSASCDVGPCDVTLTGSLDGYDFTMDLSQTGDSYSGSIDIGDNWYCGSNNEYSDTTLRVQLTPTSASAHGMTWAAESFDTTATWTIPADADGACSATTFTVDGSGGPS